MTQTLFNPITDDLAAFEAMSYPDRRRAGKRARQDAAEAGYLNKAGQRVVPLPGGGTARLTMFSR